MKPEDQLIKELTFEWLKNSEHVWIIEKRNGFIVHEWIGGEKGYVAPQVGWNTMKQSIAYLLKILRIGKISRATKKAVEKFR
jgi:hypothetical protein